MRPPPFDRIIKAVAVKPHEPMFRLRCLGKRPILVQGYDRRRSRLFSRRRSGSGACNRVVGGGKVSKYIASTCKVLAVEVSGG